MEATKKLATWIVGVVITATSSDAAIRVLDDPASPVAVTFNDTNGRMSVNVKSTGMVWSNPTSGGGTALTLTSASQPDATHLSASGLAGTMPITIGVELVPATGDVVVTLSADPLASVSGTIRYPYAFLPNDGSGFMVMPVFGGYVVPTTQTAWNVPSGHSRLEWFGGVDDAMSAGWMMIGEPAADMELGVETATIGGQSRRCGVFKWNGSNSNASGATSRFSYERRARLKFFSTGGYVAQAKHFRAYAQTQGWLVTLAEKAQANADVQKIIGAPILYLWGDGRSQAMLDGLAAAGIDRALVQISINHVDQNNMFPNQQFAGASGWSDAVRAKGYVPGIYDIYARYSAAQSQPPFNGFVYLWPSIANPQWMYRNADGTLDAQSSVNNSLAAVFARDTRLPAHNAMFDFDAYFSDVVCAVMPREDYDTTFGHFQSRQQDIEGRRALLAAVSQDHGKLAGVEQLKSWAVPVAHWGEGVFWLGGSPAGGAFNNNAYPEIMTDVKDPGAATSAVLDLGWRVPLFDLVYHDCVLATVHWHRPHNKFLYAWTLNDQFALLRGQAPLLNLVYAGAPGSIGRAITGAVDVRDGTFWDTRWTTQVVRERVVQTFNTVCAWHRAIGMMEMTDSRVLRNDFSVQMSEFSGDGGASGRGIVVNFGTYDGAQSMTGAPWSGTIREQALTVPVGGYATYEWPLVPPMCAGDANGDGHVDAADLSVLLAQFGQSVPASSGSDFNGDGAVNGADLSVLLSAFGQAC